MTLEEAIIEVESGGDDDAIGDNNLKNKAYGCMQIRQPAVDDTFPGRRAEQCLGNRAFSLEVFYKYMSRYATKKKIRRAVTDRDRANIWNQGPQGYLNGDTNYWLKVQKILYG